MSVKIITKNKKARFNYEIKESLEAGIQLTGSEVKAVKNNQINIEDAYVRIDRNEAWLWNADISQYKYSYDPDYDSRRSRKLLLKRDQIESLQQKAFAGKMTIVPLSVYLSRGLVKVEIALAKGRRSHEKQRKIKERDLERELHREKRKYMIK